MAGSLAIAVVATNATWLFLRAKRRKSAPADSVNWGVWEPLVWLIKGLFLLLLPMAGLWAGALSPYWMGLTEIDWVESLASGAVAAALGGGLIIFAWLLYRHQHPPRPRAAGQLRSWLAPIDSALLQWHWAFYRAAVIGGLTLLTAANGASTGAHTGVEAHLAADPGYWGAWLGMVLVALEWALNPFARRVLFRPQDNQEDAAAAERTVIRMALAVATTAVFVLARNFWLCLACHAMVETAIALFLPVPDRLEASSREQ